MQPRGIRNNNPLNIRKGSAWIGLDKTQDDKDFCKFIDAEHGIRAAYLLLHTYAKRGLTTVRKIISEWAPSVENNTQAYVDSVAAKLGIGPDAMIVHPDRQAPKTFTLDETTSTALLKAMIQHENGKQPYEDAVFKTAWKLSEIADA